MPPAPTGSHYIFPIREHLNFGLPWSFFDYPGLLENFATPGWRGRPRYPSPKNSTQLRLKNILNSPLKLEVALKEKKLELSSCKLKHFEGVLPGYWTGSDNKAHWSPFACRFPKGLSHKSDRFLANKWIMLAGDSNTRGLLERLCSDKGTKLVSMKPLFLCIGSNFVISQHTFWPFVPSLREFIILPLNETAGQMGITEKMLPASLRNKTEPDFFFISIGSHTAEASGPSISKMVVDSLDTLRPAWLQPRKIAVLLTTASCTSKLLGVSRLKGRVYSQNNPRLNSVNQGSLESFAGKAYALDFFSTTHPLALLSKSRDPVHFYQDLYVQHRTYFLHFLSLIFSAK